ncbi:hypothetical protein CDL12_23774 [Handroanthus impetiginosus]|uniref:Glycerophosphoryl diester phosphodiesterase membrane domain-containing protein n=1 Tax=Handroanthus impetiginosus TaxID=429701 RepID=A0A2G9GEI9_9LAMI|nr:hypothetical protein CDL12_23774 [Handroanthus impetiginosus]
MSTHSLNLWGVLSETKRIINAHSRHFLALSVLFLLPLSFSLIVYPSLAQSSSTLSYHRRSVFFFSRQEPGILPTDKSHLLLPIIYALFVLIFSLCATASITHSTFHGFYGRPVKFISSIKSVLFSFLPLIATLIATLIIAGLIVFAFGGFTALVFKGIALFGVEIDYDNVYLQGFVFLITALVVGLLIYLQVEWYLANVIVVVESRWGFSPLKRSSYLVKGMRRIAFAMILLFGILLGFLGALCSSLVPSADGISGGWVSWAFIFQTVVYTGFMTILMLYNVAANAVLFMYCKALHGELAFEIAEEFAHEYISLPFDDGKVPHVVYVV